MPKAFYKNAFELNEFGHGGEKRSFQIHELFSKVFDLVPVKAFKSVFSPWYVRYYAGLEFLIRHRLLLKQYKQLSQIGFHVINFKSWKNHHADAEFFIWEPNYSYGDFYIPLLCKQYGLKILVLPHNLESLVSNRQSFVSGKVSPDWFQEELAYLKLCDAVFTISLEDQWLLSLYGLQAHYLEYWPSSNVVSQCLHISNFRETHEVETFYLMLGTADNRPTADGMKAVIQHVLQQQTRFNLIIAGFGTEALVKQIKDLPSCVSILGRVSTDVYQKLLKTCKAVLIYQHSGTGVLTRIPELMIAGIPIIANSIALRSFHHLKGLYALPNLEGFKNMDSLHLEKPTINAEVIKQTQQQQIETIKSVISKL